jgi:tetratricopeptide (TPR) repeat protein
MDFDHAIVHVPGAPDTWIDPTARHARAGELPGPDQGRRALLVAATGGALAVTPSAASADNTTVETREIVLAELGGARVVETTELHGASERWYRNGYERGLTDDLRKRLADYATNAYRGTLGEIKHGDVADLSRSFELRLAVADAEAAFADGVQAAVSVGPGEVLDGLPSVFEPPAKSEAAPRPRRGDYVFPQPFVVERRYRIVPAAGYGEPVLPASRTESLGPATFSQTWTIEAGTGVVSGTLRFDSGRARMTAEEFEQFRAGVARLRSDPGDVVRFAQLGEQHLQAGRIAEALAEFRRLAERHPKEAFHLTQQTMALLAAGLGEPARDVARRAVAVEPGSALAHRRLAWALEHDMFGRRFGRGFELREALAEYGRAKELEPKDASTRSSLAYLLEHDADGVHWGPTADLGTAITEYEALVAMDDRYAERHLVCLVQAERAEAARARARALPAGDTRNAALVWAAAALEGVPAAVREAARLENADRRRIALATAGETFLQQRRYALAADLLAEAARGSAEAARLNARSDLLRNVKRIEDTVLPPEDPATVVKKLMAAALAHTLTEEQAHEWMTVPAGVSSAAAAFTSGIDRAMLALRPKIRDGSLRHGVMGDFTSAVAQWSVDGDARFGFRVRVQDLAGSAHSLFVKREAGRDRVLTTEIDLPGLAREALQLLEAGDLEAARRWLDWAREAVKAAPTDDPFSGHPLARLWTVGQAADAAPVRLAALATIVTDGLEADVAALDALAPTAPADASADLDVARARGHRRRGRLVELLAACDRLEAAKPRTSAVFLWRWFALEKLGRLGELRKLAEARLADVPGDADAEHALASVDALEGRLADSRAHYLALIDSGRAGGLDYNNAAWSSLVLGEADEKALTLARRAVQADGNSTASLHTLAALYAEIGRPAEARQTLVQLVDAREGGSTTEDWLVLGRIAEQYGERDYAVTAYERVPKPDPVRIDATWNLTQRRLAALRASSRRPARQARRRD